MTTSMTSRRKLLFCTVVFFGIAATLLLYKETKLLGNVAISLELLRRDIVIKYGHMYPDVFNRTVQRLKSLKIALEELHNNFTRFPPSRFPPNSRAYCPIYDEEGHLPRVFIPRVWSSATIQGVTLMAQVSGELKRLQMFQNVINGWPGPVSLTVYVNKGRETLLQNLKKVPSLLVKPNIELHLAADNARVYPQNALRQLTLNQVRTEFCFHVDADFVPSIGLYEHLVNLTKQEWPAKKLLVIPAMEYLYEQKEYPPITKEELLKLWRQAKVQSFKQITIREEHHFTDFPKWITANQSYWIPQHHERFEPYVVFRTKEVPAYNERFTGGLNDKISHILSMVASGFKMEVDARHFVIHMPHIRKDNKAPERPHFLYCNKKIYAEYVAGLCKQSPKIMKDIFWQVNVRAYDKRKLLPSDCPSKPKEMKHKKTVVSSITL